jgi:hypothetical protein
MCLLIATGFPAVSSEKSSAGSRTSTSVPVRSSKWGLAP